jgi:hypothetical protein
VARSRSGAAECSGNRPRAAHMLMHAATTSSIDGDSDKGLSPELPEHVLPFIEVGELFRTHGARGHLLMRVRTPLSDARVGILGRRCAMIHVISDISFPLLISPLSGRVPRPQAGLTSCKRPCGHIHNIAMHCYN